jgi:5-amino-6-(5-phosphoribosylamino)uracil reductase
MRKVTRPHCVLNVAISLDGKIGTYRREKFQFPSRNDRKVMDRIRAAADAILIGGASLRVDDPPLRVRSPSLIRDRVRRGQPEQPIGIVASKSLDLPVNSRFFREDPGRRIVVTVSGSPARRRSRIEPVAEIWIAGNKDLSVPRLLSRLRRRGVRRLLLETGGSLSHLFLARDLIDEVYVTVCPLVIGGAGAPTPFDGPGLLARQARRARLLSARRIGQELFLHYRMVPSGR